ncbi:MAG TPA: hypothetical protein VGC63_04790 [Solirubrobacterales bacterium]|jgi:hypothetical protein
MTGPSIEDRLTEVESRLEGIEHLLAAYAKRAGEHQSLRLTQRGSRPRSATANDQLASPCGSIYLGGDGCTSVFPRTTSSRDRTGCSSTRRAATNGWLLMNPGHQSMYERLKLESPPQQELEGFGAVEA